MELIILYLPVWSVIQSCVSATGDLREVIMELIFRFKKGVYTVHIGYSMPWFEQSYFISIERLWFDDMQVSYAEIVWHS